MPILIIYFSIVFISGVEVRCIGHFKLLFSLLRLTGAEKLQKLALEVFKFTFFFFLHDSRLILHDYTTGIKILVKLLIKQCLCVKRYMFHKAQNVSNICF